MAEIIGWALLNVFFYVGVYHAVKHYMERKAAQKAADEVWWELTYDD